MKVSNIVTNPKERERFVKFCAVGTFGALVDFGSFHLFLSVLRIPAVVAQALSFSAAVTSNFLWNRFWTYPDSRSKPVVSQVVTFFVVNVIGLAIRTPIFSGLEPALRSLFSEISFLPIGFVTADRLGYTIALGVAVVVVLFWNFFINRVWTYNDVD